SKFTRCKTGDPPNRISRPFALPGRRDPGLVELIGDYAVRFTLSDRRPNERRKVASPGLCPCLPGLNACLLATGRKATVRIAPRASQPIPPLFGGCQDSFHSLGLKSRFVFGDGRKHVNGEPVRVRKIDCYELEPALHQSRNH